MKVLITGALGFIGTNLRIRLSREPDIQILTFDINNQTGDLVTSLIQADLVVHLAGVNRPKDIDDFYTGNLGLTEIIAQTLEEKGKEIPIIFASSIQAELNNDYGKSKRAAEERLQEYSQKTGARVRVFRFANVFGKWCRPNYNSAIATFCYNIAHELPITINNPSAVLKLLYIDDAVSALERELYVSEPGFAFAKASPVYETTVGEVANLIREFHEARRKNVVLDFSDEFLKKLNTTYLSYIDVDSLSSKVEFKSDGRGWLFEFLKSKHFGQIFVSTTKPGKKRGNHYHDTKVEKFCLIKGKATICLRKVDDSNVLVYEVNDKDIRIVDIPPGYTHSIENTGKQDCIVLFWANELFDQAHPDTYFAEV